MDSSSADGTRRGLGFRWTNTQQATETLAEEKRYYALLFSHEFARSFWKAGERITFLVPNQTFKRTRPDGSIGVVTRKAYTRRSGREDAWKYHLRELAMAEEPLRYMRRYLRVEEELDEDADTGNRRANLVQNPCSLRIAMICFRWCRP